MKRWFRRRPDVSALPAFQATEDGWFLPDGDGEVTPARAYLAQLVEEGHAVRAAQPLHCRSPLVGDALAPMPSIQEHRPQVGSYKEQQGSLRQGILIGWVDVYTLQSDPRHESSLPLLALPPEAPERPVLSAVGTPADMQFHVRIDGWSTPQGRPILPERTGPVLDPDHTPRLLPRVVHALLREIESLGGQGAQWSADARMLAMGRIQSLARVAGATMDRYLATSPVVVADRLELDLHDHSVADTPVIELVPAVPGAPEWLSQFDRYDSARSRYDLSTGDGDVAHVVLPEPTRRVAEAIKAMPARRLGGVEAASFLQNPYPFLGEDADQVIPHETFQQAKTSAGLVEWELDLRSAEEGWDAVLVDASGIGGGDDFLGTLDMATARDVLKRASQAREAGWVAFRWRDHNIALAGLTLESLARLQAASVEQARTQALGTDALFDLSRYSDRVVGFDGQVVLVPRVQPQASGSLLGDFSEAIDAVDPLTGDVHSAPLSVDDLGELARRVDAAEQSGNGQVRVPGLDRDIPTSEGRALIEALKQAASRDNVRPVAAPREPAPADKLGLRILHNIEQLDYVQQTGAPGDSDGELELPAALRPGIELKQHQRNGVAWMQSRMDLVAQGVRGLLLADDMGLGKTLQALCLMAWYRQRMPSPRPSLVVAPVSLLENWKAEIEKFLDGSQGATLTLYGEHLARHRLAGEAISPQMRQHGLKKALRPGFADGAAFVLTTYETLRDYQLSLAQEHWGVLVCDEAQKIKTPGAMVTRAAKAMQADFKIACTGTPVENSLADLWCLFDFFQPGLLDSLSQFTRVFRQCIEERGEGHETLVESLRGQIRPWVLRRMKDEVTELKPKTVVPCEIPMSRLQRSLYAAAAREFRDAMESENGAGATALGLLHRLRMICANPLAASNPQAEFLPIDEHLAHSPKLAWLLATLEGIRQRDGGNGEKVIVFSEFLDIQRLIQRAVAARFEFNPSVVNGSTTVDPRADASRQALIDAFQAKPGFGVIVLSTTAVGFGVNIQQANHVIHFTRPWNPAKEDQATDRAYRIGQEREVFVYYPTIAGDGFESFEQRLATRLDKKRALSSDMLAPDQSVGWDEFSDLAG